MKSHILITTGEEVCEPGVEMTLDTIGREFGEQARVPDHVKSTRYVEGYGSDFMSDIEDLHPLLGEPKQHIRPSAMAQKVPVNQVSFHSSGG